MGSWPNKPLDEVCLIRPPKRESKAELNGDDEVSFVPMEALGIRQKSFGSTQTRPLEKVYGGYTYFADRDVLLAKITPCFQNGKLGIADGLKNGVGFGSSEFFVFRCLDQLIPEFLFYFLSQQSFTDAGVAQMSGAVGHQRVPLRFIQSHPIPLPPLPEQERIVAILDEAFVAIATATANAERNLQNAHALFESHLNAVFSQRGKGWEKRSLVSVCELFVDSAHRTPKYQDEGIPALRPRDIVNGRLNLAGARRVSEAEYEIQSKRHKPSPGDIVYSRELSYGWAALLPKSPRVCLSQGICLFRPSSNLDAAFLLHVLNGSIGRAQAVRSAVGAAHPHINLGDIKSYSIPLPPLDEQRKITRQLDELSEETRRLSTIHEQKLAALEALKKSLLHQAFTGELTADANVAVHTLSEAGV